MSDQPAARPPQQADGHGGLRLLALAAVALGVLLLAAAAFVLSYAGIHAVALSAGVSPRLARIYPLIFDAMLVVSGAAVLALRGAGLPSRCYAWFSMLALLAAAAAADALHATGTRLPRRPTAATAAVIPWALVLVGFGLLLCLLRQARLRRAAAAVPRPSAAPGPSGHVSVRPAIVSPPGPGTANGDGADRPAAAATADLASDLAIDAEPGPDDPASDEAGPADPPDAARVPRAREEQRAGQAASAFSPAPTPALAIFSVTEPPPDAAAAAGPGPGVDDADRSGPGTHPAADSAAEPDAQAPPGTDAPQAANAEPDAQADIEAAAEPGPDGDPEAGTEPGATTQPEAQADIEAAAEPEPDGDPEAGTEPGATTQPEAQADIEAAAEPEPAVPQFDRMRSSPVPPDA